MLNKNPPPMRWRTSSRSTGGGDCVEVALGDVVLMRDSSDPNGPVLQFTAAQLRELVEAFKRGELAVRDDGTY